MIKTRKRDQKEIRLMNLKPTEIKKKWDIIKSIIKTENQNDPAEGITLERRKTYFESLGTNGEENDPNPNSYNQNFLKITPSQKNSLHEILNQPFQKQDIDMILKKLKKSKSVGIDNLRIEVIKCCIENNSTFSYIIQFLGNELLKFEKYPKLWETDLIRRVQNKKVQVRSQIIEAYH